MLEVSDWLGDCDTLGLSVFVGDCDPETLCEFVLLAVTDSLGETVADGDTVPLNDCVWVRLWESV